MDENSKNKKRCAFFGHRQYSYEAYRNTLKSMFIELIEKKGVTEFYGGGRGAFDGICASVLKQLQQQYTDIRIIQVLSYIPINDDPKKTAYDETVYLLNRFVPQRYAILETNKLLVEKVDFVVSGVCFSWGGAAKAIEYALRRRKEIIQLIKE